MLCLPKTSNLVLVAMRCTTLRSIWNSYAANYRNWFLSTRFRSYIFLSVIYLEQLKDTGVVLQ